MEGTNTELLDVWNKRRFDIQMLFLIVATFCFFNTSVGAPTPGQDYWWHNACDSNISTLQNKKRHSRNAKITALDGVIHHYGIEVEPYMRKMNGINNTVQIKMRWLPRRIQMKSIIVYHKQLCTFAATIQQLRNIKVNTEDENLIISRKKVLDSTKDHLQNLICEVQHEMHKRGIKQWRKFTPAKLKVKINSTMDGSAVYQEDYGVLTLYGQYLNDKPRKNPNNNNNHANKSKKIKNQGRQKKPLENSLKNPKKNQTNQQNKQNNKRGNKRKQKLQENGKTKNVKKVIL